MLRRRYEDRATDVWRAAVHPQTTAIYDILRVVAREAGATYDELVERTGLARSTVRYHVGKLEDQGVLKRLGNPVLVVYDAEALREKAEEILQSVRPEDTPEDAEERAQEREERREQQRESDDEETEEDESDRARSAWAYLAEMNLTPADLYTSLETTDGDLGDRDVRVRRDRLPDRLR
jgi:DNA-binding Lrp family transcriptional regulator